MAAHHRLWIVALALGLFLPASAAWAQRDRDRDRDTPQPPRVEQNRDRDGDRDRDRERTAAPRPEREDERGTEEGMPELNEGAPRLQFDPGRRDPRFRQGWRLGVYAVNTDTGVRITQIVPRTPAERSGLERDDVIVTVNGYQIGHVAGGFYPLGEELQRRANSQGEVTLLVQDRRSGRLLNVPVRLERRGAIGLRP